MKMQNPPLGFYLALFIRQGLEPPVCPDPPRLRLYVLRVLNQQYSNLPTIPINYSKIVTTTTRHDAHENIAFEDFRNQNYSLGR